MVTELEKDDLKVLDKFRRLKDFGFGHITVKVQNSRLVGVEYAEFHAVPLAG